MKTKKVNLQRDIIGKPQMRSLTLTRELDVDEDSRTIRGLSFASDKPIEHWFGLLKLSMKPEAIRTARIESGAPLLLCHNTYDSNEQIGVVEPGTFTTANGVARADVRFSSSQRGEEIFVDVKDGIRRNVSFGFFVHSIVLESEEDGIPTYRSDDWEPYEVSFVPVAADISIGVGRSLNLNNPIGEQMKNKKNINRADEEMTDEEREAEEAAQRAEEEAAQAEEEEAQRAEEEAQRSADPKVKRAAALVAFGTIFGERAFAEDYAMKNPDGTVDGLRAAIAEKRAKNPSTPVPNKPVPQADLSRANYGGPLNSFKGKNARQNALRAGHFFRAALLKDEASIEYCRENNISLKRDHSGRNNATGGVFVIPEVEAAIIDLRIEYGAFRRNSHVVSMGTDTKVIPRRKGGLKAYPVGAGQAGTYSETDWDQIELVARKWMVLTKIEDELEEDSIINFADMLVSEIAYAFTFSEDDAGFNGDGTSQYHGIVGVIPKLRGVDANIANIKGLKVASGNAWSEITEGDMLAVVGLLPQFARKSGSVKWYCSHEFWANVLERIALAKGGVTYAEINGELKKVFMGKEVEIVETMPHSEANSQICLLYGNLAQASTFGDRRGVTIKMTDTNDNDFERDVQSIKGTERFDIVVHEVGDTTAAGPIVGLITAAA